MSMPNQDDSSSSGPVDETEQENYQLISIEGFPSPPPRIQRSPLDKIPNQENLGTGGSVRRRLPVARVLYGVPNPVLPPPSPLAELKQREFEAKWNFNLTTGLPVNLPEGEEGYIWEQIFPVPEESQIVPKHSDIETMMRRKESELDDITIRSHLPILPEKLVEVPKMGPPKRDLDEIMNLTNDKSTPLKQRRITDFFKEQKSKDCGGDDIEVKVLEDGDEKSQLKQIIKSNP